MAAAGRDMAQALAELPLTPMSRTLVSNATGQPTRRAPDAHQAIMDQLTSPVRWVQSVQAMLDMRVDTFIEAGPKTVLTGLIKRSRPGTSRCLVLRTPRGSTPCGKHWIFERG